jgi:hypothetical protein
LKVELLYFDGCPSWQAARATLHRVLDEMGYQDVSVELVQVETDEEAKKHRFVGSPTIRVNGRDLFPIDGENYALGCRVYHTSEGLRGVPPAEALWDAIAQAIDT